MSRKRKWDGPKRVARIEAEERTPEEREAYLYIRRMQAEEKALLKPIGFHGLSRLSVTITRPGWRPFTVRTPHGRRVLERRRAATRAARRARRLNRA